MRLGDRADDSVVEPMFFSVLERENNVGDNRAGVVCTVALSEGLVSVAFVRS